MILFKRAADVANWLDKQRASGNSIGFVPTLGALHAGHISLIDISKKTTHITVCSIFVNPTQFNDPKDFQKYPVTIEKDIVLLEKAGTDVLFLPEVGDLYPGGTDSLERYDLGRLETLLEGKYRPGHFQGVCQVVRRLLDLVRPDELFMGSKDYQQCMVVGRLLVLTGMATVLHRCPIVREGDGLAMSSRNVRLSAEERVKATAIYRALKGMKEGWREKMGSGSVGKGLTGRGPGGIEEIAGLLTGEAKKMLEQAGFRIDYVEIADAETLEALETGRAGGRRVVGAEVVGGAEAAGAGANVGAGTEDAVGAGGGRVVALVAAFQGEVRLIDNMVF